MGDVKRYSARDPGQAAAKGRSAGPDSEVAEKPERRKYSAEYKLRILQEVDMCSEPGEIGALLRREGLYSSYLNTWKKQREKGTLAALSPRKRGRKATPVNPLSARMAELEGENRRLAERLNQAETIIEVQKKVSEMLKMPTSDPESGGGD